MTSYGSWRTVVGALYGYGALPWTEVTRILDGFLGVWGDVDGMHLAEPLPSEAPAYTHVWAWHGEVYARVRLDLPSSRHTLGVLVVGGDQPDGRPLVAETEVAATVYPLRGWGDLDRVARLPAQFRNPALERLVVHQHAVTFVRQSETGHRSAPEMVDADREGRPAV